MNRQPHSLFDLSLKETCKAFDATEPTVFDCLPLPIQRPLRRQLKRQWMRETELPDDVATYEYRYLDLTLLDKDEFIMVTNHPRTSGTELWPSNAISAHIYMNYYEFRIGDCDPLLLCRSCFLTYCIPTNCHWMDIDYLEYWTSMNWTFYNVIKHYVTNRPRRLIRTLRNKNSWCDRCVLFPLFELHDYNSCTRTTHMHDDDDTDDDNDHGSETYDCESNQIFDAYVH